MPHTKSVHVCIKGQGSILTPLQTLYPSPFSLSRKTTNEVQAKYAPSVVTTLAPIATANPISKKEIEALRKRESGQL
jgi:chromosome segregation and condensation protein ScpB